MKQTLQYYNTMSLEDLNQLHKDLRKYKYFYYEKHEALIEDHTFDKLEKAYDVACEEFQIKQTQRLSNFVGFNLKMPMSIYEIDLDKKKSPKE